MNKVYHLTLRSLLLINTYTFNFYIFYRILLRIYAWIWFWDWIFFDETVFNIVWNYYIVLNSTSIFLFTSFKYLSFVFLSIFDYYSSIWYFLSVLILFFNSSTAAILLYVYSSYYTFLFIFYIFFFNFLYYSFGLKYFYSSFFFWFFLGKYGESWGDFTRIFMFDYSCCDVI